MLFSHDSSIYYSKLPKLLKCFYNFWWRCLAKVWDTCNILRHLATLRKPFHSGQDFPLSRAPWPGLRKQVTWDLTGHVGQPSSCQTAHEQAFKNHPCVFCIASNMERVQTCTTPVRLWKKTFLSSRQSTKHTDRSLQIAKTGMIRIQHQA